MRERARICFATFRYAPMNGGVARAATRIVQFLQAENFDIHVCVFAEPDEPVDAGPYMHRIEIPSEAEGPLERAMTMYEAIRRLDRELSFDLFHAFFLPAAMPCLNAIAGSPRPLIASSRGSDAALWQHDPARRQLLRSVLTRAAWITSVSRDGLRRLSEIASLEGRSSVIPNSVEEAAFAAPWQLEAGNRGIVGTLAEFYPVKRIPLLIEAYAATPRSVRKKLLLVGGFADAAERERILAAIEREQIAPEIEITGYSDPQSVARHLRRMHVFVQCSESEGFSNALLEAAAAGLPIVTTGSGGVEELSEIHKDSVVTVPADRHALARAIALLLSNDASAQTHSTAARFAAREFSPRREQEAWLALYRRMLASTITARPQSIARTRPASAESGRSPVPLPPEK